jgi:DNA sulfur modification protein DndE
MAIEHVRLSEQAREHLIKLKRWTGIKNWNVLSRWAFCVSLAEPTIPPNVTVASDTAVEMTWKVFGGVHSEVFLALLKARCKLDGLPLDDETIATQFRLHLHRGISYLAAGKSIRSISDLVERAVAQS